MRAAYTDIVGNDELGNLAMTFLSTAKEPSTYKGYSSNFHRFVEFCSEEQPPLDPLAGKIFVFGNIFALFWK